MKIVIAKDQTVAQTEEQLFKAMKRSRDGEAHTEDFKDKAISNSVKTSLKKYENSYKGLIHEILDVLKG